MTACPTLAKTVEALILQLIVAGIVSPPGQRSAYHSLQHIMSAVAINLARFAAWIDEKPLAETRTSPFAALANAKI